MRTLANYRSATRYDDASNRLFGAIYSGGGQISDSRRFLIDLTIRRLKDQGIWDRLDCLYMFAALDTVSARTNWKNPGTFNATEVNSPTFTADRGYAGDGAAKGLDTGFDPGTAGGSFSRNSASVGVWKLTTGAASNDRAFAFRMGGTCETVLITATTPGLTTELNGTTFPTATPSAASGFFVLDRTVSTGYTIYENGAALEAETSTSAALGSENARFMQQNGIGSGFSSAQFACGFLGGGLDADKNRAIHQTFRAYLESVGAV